MLKDTKKKLVWATEMIATATTFLDSGLHALCSWLIEERYQY